MFTGNAEKDNGAHNAALQQPYNAQILLSTVPSWCIFSRLFNRLFLTCIPYLVPHHAPQAGTKLYQVVNLNNQEDATNTAPSPTKYCTPTLTVGHKGVLYCDSDGELCDLISLFPTRLVDAYSFADMRLVLIF